MAEESEETMRHKRRVRRGGSRRSARIPILVLAILALGAGCANPFARNFGAAADAHAAAGRHDEAVREIELAVRAHPHHRGLREQASRIHAESGDWVRAIGHLEVVAVDLKPDDADVWIAIAELETRRNNIADAYVAFRRAAQLAPEEIRAVSGLALSADSLGLDDEAEAAYASWARLEQALDNPPANAK